MFETTYKCSPLYTNLLACNKIVKDGGFGDQWRPTLRAYDGQLAFITGFMVSLLRIS